MDKIQFPDFTMAYEDIGRGKAILFIHGYPLNRAMWQPQMDGLSQSLRVIAPDLRGHGDSTSTKGTYSMELLADDCLSLINHLGIDKVYLCGLSMGGYISFVFVNKYPHRLAGLILTSTRANPDTLEGKANRDHTIQNAQINGTAPIIENMIPNLLSPYSLQNRPELVEKLRRIMQSVTLEGIIGDLSGMKERKDSSPLLPLITVPTLIIHGRDDPLIPVSEAQAMKTAIPHSQLVILDRCGHLPNLEASNQFNQAILDFITHTP